MLPFTDIDFFLFAGLYIALIWLSKLVVEAHNYKYVTFTLTLWYILFYFQYTAIALGFYVYSFFYIRFLAGKINHRLVSALVLALPMILVKTHVNLPFLYF